MQEGAQETSRGPGIWLHGSYHGEMWAHAAGNVEAGLIKLRSKPSDGVWGAGFGWTPTYLSINIHVLVKSPLNVADL